MALLAVQYITDAGAEPTFSAANVTDTAPIGSGHDTFICVKNADVTNAKTVTIAVSAINDNGDAIAAHVVPVPISSVVKIPLRRSYDPGTGLATVTIGGTGTNTNVTSYVARIA